MLAPADRGDLASSIISSKRPSRRWYADQTGTDLPVSATLILTVMYLGPAKNRKRAMIRKAP